MLGSRTSAVISLRALGREDAPVAGMKAAVLGQLLRAGFDVPDGVVVLGEPTEDALAAAERLGGPWAVRSSGTAEDLPGASFAGQYETVLDVVGPEALLAAIRHCRESATASRVALYRSQRGATADSRMAVLVQRMVKPDAAGVAFTANPITGDREEIVITAGRGMGEHVVGGEATADEWRVSGGKAVCSRSVEHAIDAHQALELAKLCGRVQDALGGPQDIEWAIEGQRMYVLQARPITALPPPVRWVPPSPGHWTRNFRIGEWLPEAMTPLFEDWLLARMEAGYLLGMKNSIGAAVPFRHASVNGWYYTATPRFPLAVFVRAAFESRGRVFRFILNGLLRVGSRPEMADRKLLRRLADEWRGEILPRYRRLVTEGEAVVDAASQDELARWIDEIGSLAGEALWSLAIVGGSAWKMEACLAKFLHQHVPDLGEGGVQALLTGLPGVYVATTFAPHAVQTLDWYRPTAGELVRSEPGDLPDRRERAVATRKRLEGQCRAALHDDQAQLARFDALLEVAQRYAAIREEQSGLLTLAWPVLRRAVQRLGDAAVTAGFIADSDDAFFLTRGELLGRADARERSRQRRAEWERQRRLVAPLVIGTPSKLFERSVNAVVEAVRSPRPSAEGAIVGHPASPGRATGKARLVRGPEDFERFQQGEVLVAKGTAPAWTPLFARAAAVVTDGGSLAAHASLVAREYGIPSVVGTGDATVRLRDGQVVTVDGSAGVVELS
jgi:phosphohistidine swiveling domain-containing protein